MYKYLYTYVNFFTLLETKRKKPHRGTILENAVKSSAVNISQMVKRMGISRGTYYNHINDPNLSLELLSKYGKILKHDFSHDLPDLNTYILEEPLPSYKKPKTLSEAQEQIDYWKEKYFQLMELYHKELTRNKKA